MSHNTLLVFEEQAKKLDVKVGDTLTLSAPTMRGTNNTVDVRVAAIAANVGMLSSFNVYVPNSTLHGLYQMRADATGARSKGGPPTSPSSDRARSGGSPAPRTCSTSSATSSWPPPRPRGRRCSRRGAS